MARCAGTAPRAKHTKDRARARTCFPVDTPSKCCWVDARFQKRSTCDLTRGGAGAPPTGARPPPPPLTAQERLATHADAEAALAKFSAIDRALNRLDAVIASAQKASTSTNGADASLVQTLDKTTARAREVRGELTADYHNDEDSIQIPGKLREDVQGLNASGLGGPPTQAQRSFAARVGAEYTAAMHDVTAFFASDVATANRALAAAGAAPLAESQPAPKLDCATDEEG